MLGFPFGRRALPRLDARKKTRGGKTPARQPNRSRSGDLDLQKDGPDPAIRPYRLQSSVAGDRLIAIGARAGTLALQKDRSRSGDLDLQRDGPDRQIRPYRIQFPCSWRSPDRHRDRIRRCCFYFACFTSPNVFNARCAGETGPRNRRVINVSGLPPNETSSI